MESNRENGERGDDFMGKEGHDGRVVRKYRVLVIRHSREDGDLPCILKYVGVPFKGFFMSGRFQIFFGRCIATSKNSVLEKFWNDDPPLF